MLLCCLGWLVGWLGLRVWVLFLRLGGYIVLFVVVCCCLVFCFVLGLGLIDLGFGLWV